MLLKLWMPSAWFMFCDEVCEPRCMWLAWHCVGVYRQDGPPPLVFLEGRDFDCEFFVGRGSFSEAFTVSPRAAHFCSLTAPQRNDDG